MPVYERDIDIYDGIMFNQMVETDHPEKSEDMGAVWRAAWATTATQGAINWFNEPSYEDDPAFEVNWSSMPEEQRHIFPELQEAGSQLEYDSIVERDRVNRENYSIIANGGVDGIIAAFATGILDPITLPLWFVPFVGTGFKAAGAGGRIGRISGYALADVAARDTILHHSDPSRTANETYKNLLIAASVSSALGMMSMRTMARVPNTTKKTVVDEVERHAGQTADIELAGQSVGAMFVGKVKPSVALEKPVRGAKWWRHTMIQTPVLRSAFSTEVNLAAPAKRMSELVYSGITKEKHLLGIADDFAVPVDVEARTIGKINMAVNLSEIKKLRSALKKKGVLIKTEELNNLMESMVVYGDVYRIPKHLEPHRELFFPMAKRIRENRAIRLERLQKQRMLSDDVEPKFNKFYGPRLFSKKKMDELPNVWVAGVVRGYKARGSTKTVEQLEERALQAYRNAATTAKHLDAELGGIRRIPRSRKTLKGISLEIDDEFIEEFLIRDVIKAEAHLDRLEGELILRERYGFDEVTLTDRGVDVHVITKEYDDEFQALHSSLVKKGQTQKAEKLTRKFEVFKKDLQHVLNKIVGHGEHDGVISGGVARFLNETRAWTSAAWNGNSVIASLQEPMKGAINHGFGPVFASLKTLAFKKGETAQAKEMMRAFGTGIDMQSHRSAAMARAEVDDSVVADGLKTLGSRVVAPALYKWNGQELFNDVIKTGAATTHGDQLIRYATGKQAAKVGSPEYKMTIAEFAKLGIGKKEFTRIKAMVKDGEGFTEVDGVLFPNLDEWTDTYISNRVGQTMTLYGETIVLGGGTGTVPRLVDNPVGRMATQFKRILFNMQGQTIVPLAQRLAAGDMRAARGMSAMLGVAWLQYQFRVAMSVGFDPDKFEKKWSAQTIQDHVFHMYDRSGLGAMMFDFLSMGDNMLEGSVSSTLGINQSMNKYYHNTTGIGNIMPAFSMLEKVTRAGLSPFTEDGFRQSDASAIGTSFPLRNIFYYDFILDEIQKAAIQDLPGGQRDKKTRLQKFNF